MGDVCSANNCGGCIRARESNIDPKPNMAIRQGSNSSAYSGINTPNPHPHIVYSNPYQQHPQHPQQHPQQPYGHGVPNFGNPNSNGNPYAPQYGNINPYQNPHGNPYGNINPNIHPNGGNPYGAPVNAGVGAYGNVQGKIVKIRSNSNSSASSIGTGAPARSKYQEIQERARQSQEQQKIKQMQYQSMKQEKRKEKEKKMEKKMKKKEKDKEKDKEKRNKNKSKKKNKNKNKNKINKNDTQDIDETEKQSLLNNDEIKDQGTEIIEQQTQEKENENTIPDNQSTNTNNSEPSNTTPAIPDEKDKQVQVEAEVQLQSQSNDNLQPDLQNQEDEKNIQNNDDDDDDNTENKQEETENNGNTNSNSNPSNVNVNADVNTDANPNTNAIPATAEFFWVADSTNNDVASIETTNSNENKENSENKNDDVNVLANMNETIDVSGGIQIPVMDDMDLADTNINPDLLSSVPTTPAGSAPPQVVVSNDTPFFNPVKGAISPMTNSNSNSNNNNNNQLGIATYMPTFAESNEELINTNELDFVQSKLNGNTFGGNTSRYDYDTHGAPDLSQLKGLTGMLSGTGNLSSNDNNNNSNNNMYIYNPHGMPLSARTTEENNNNINRSFFGASFGQPNYQNYQNFGNVAPAAAAAPAAPASYQDMSSLINMQSMPNMNYANGNLFEIEKANSEASNEKESNTAKALSVTSENDIANQEGTDAKLPRAASLDIHAAKQQGSQTPRFDSNGAVISNFTNFSDLAKNKLKGRNSAIIVSPPMGAFAQGQGPAGPAAPAAPMGQGMTMKQGMPMSGPMGQTMGQPMGQAMGQAMRGQLPVHPALGNRHSQPLMAPKGFGNAPISPAQPVSGGTPMGGQRQFFNRKPQRAKNTGTPPNTGLPPQIPLTKSSSVDPPLKQNSFNRLSPKPALVNPENSQRFNLLDMDSMHDEMSAQLLILEQQAKIHEKVQGGKKMSSIDQEHMAMLAFKNALDANSVH